VLAQDIDRRLANHTIGGIGESMNRASKLPAVATISRCNKPIAAPGNEAEMFRAFSGL
jgi:hypothetical protein